jgi:hypothetical protein
MTNDKTLSPSNKMNRKLAEERVLTVETSRLNFLRVDKKTNELEKKLTNEFYKHLEHEL